MSFWLKRDDLLDSEFDGNKARKFYSLLHDDLDDYDTVISFGGSQSNAMYSLSVLAKKKGLTFRYYTRKLSSFLAQNPSGNLKHALANGMELVELSNDEYDDLSTQKFAKNELFVPQGGACDYAIEGVELLSVELNSFCASNGIKAPKAILSCGTGATAVYLQQKFDGIVYAVPCVGDGSYLKRQFESLLPAKKHPVVIDTAKKYHFGKPYDRLLEIYERLLGQGVEFDLLYDCKAWLAVEENIALFEDGETIFVHSGGVRGNETMLQRYDRPLLKPKSISLRFPR